MLKKPFDTLETVNELIKLRKGKGEDGKKWKVMELATYFNCTYDIITETLRFHDIRIRNIIEVSKQSNVIVPPSKYAHLLEEPINKGHDYEYLLKQQGYKKPKMDSFQRIRSYKEKKELPCE